MKLHVCAREASHDTFAETQVIPSFRKLHQYCDFIVLEKHEITNFPCDTIYGRCTTPDASFGGKACPAGKFLGSHTLPVGASGNKYSEILRTFQVERYRRIG